LLSYGFKCWCRTISETAGEEDEGVCAAAAAAAAAASAADLYDDIHVVCAQAEEKRLSINEFLAAVLSISALTPSAQDEVLVFLHM
jgi:hypothetical protein